MLRVPFTEEQELFRKTVSGFLKAEVEPHVREWNETGRIPRDIYRKAGQAGLLLMWAEEEFGGMGLDDLRFEQVLSEEIGKVADCPFVPVLHNRVVGPYFRNIGSREQQERFLPGAISGDTILAVAMTEPGAGSDLRGIKTTAKKTTDGWLLSGSKTYISNGLNASVVIVAAKTNPDDARSVGLFIVEEGMKGFERGRKLRKMGLHGQDTAELFFDDVLIPFDNVLGEPDRGMRYLMQGLAEERVCVCFGSIASARLALELTCNYVAERKMFGQRLADMQNTRFKLAEVATEIEMAQHFVDRCVTLVNEGRITLADAAMAKLFASEVQGRAVDIGVQLHGGAGYMDEYPISRLYSNARVTRIFGGASEIMKEIVARDLLDE